MLWIASTAPKDVGRSRSMMSIRPWAELVDEVGPDEDAVVAVPRIFKRWTAHAAAACSGRTSCTPERTRWRLRRRIVRTGRRHGHALDRGFLADVEAGPRFARHAAKQGEAVGIVNRGRTRGDD